LGKRIAIVSVILLFIGLAVLGYFIQQGRKRILTDPYKSVSPSACIVIETVDLQNFINSLSTGTGIFGEIEKIKNLENFTTKVKFLAGQLNKPVYKNILEGSTSLISFYPSGKGKLTGQLSLNIPADIRFRHLKEMLHSADISTVLEDNSGGLHCLMIPYLLDNRKDTLYMMLNSGLLVCTATKQQALAAVAQISSEDDIRIMPGFSRVHLTSGKYEDKIFVVFPNLEKVLLKFFRPEKKELADRVAALAGTAGGDIYLSSDGLVLNGYTESTDSTEYLYRYKSITPREFHEYRILPSETELFETMILPAGMRNEMIGTSGLEQYVGNEITRAIIDIKGQQLANNSVVIYELLNRVQAEQIFTGGLEHKQEITYFRPDDQVKLPVYKAPATGVASLAKPGFSPGFDEKYVAFWDNYLISGGSYMVVARLLYANILKKTLANDIAYRDFESTLPSRAGYYFYCVPPHIIDFLSGYLSDSIIKTLNASKSSLSKIQSAGFQLASSNSMIYNSLSIRYKEEAREETNAEWETLLDTVAAIKPFFFTNHNTGAREIFIQDMSNNIYLINAAGRVLWKVPLNEKITGNIYMIDYYRNGKYQLLFSGKNYLHLIDRNGNYVERYPVKLRSPATNSLAIFDYDNNLNYRIFIAGEDKMIYSYDKTGSVVKGWHPFRTAGTVNSEVCYFRVSGKDYIVVSDQSSVYFLDRRGNKRLNLSDAVTRASGSSMRLSQGSEPSVVCSSPDGTVQHIYFDGTVRKFTLGKFSSDHSFDVFDINGDGYGEYIFIDKGVLYLYGNNRKQMFTRDFGSEHLGGPINFIFSSTDRKIGVFDADRNLIFLLDKNGKTINGFPLRGASMFSIGKLSDKKGWNLIVGGTDRFLYNYRIETN
jgi:hypothetical protein